MSTLEPLWLATLREAAKPPLGAATARRLGYSPGVISAVLKGKYTGNLAAVQRAVERELLNATVDCPVLGVIATSDCLTNQRLPFAATNPHRVQLACTCPTCHHRSQT